MNTSRSSGSFNRAHERRWWQRGLATVLAVGAVLVFGACAQSNASVATSAAEVEPAATYRAGYGLKLSAEGARFIGLETAEVGLRPAGNARAATVVPARAVLRTIKGDSVFVVNGEWLLRTEVVVGARGADVVEISEGLYEGDEVVVTGVDALWLAEIAAVNGGVGCADGH